MRARWGSLALAFRELKLTPVKENFLWRLGILAIFWVVIFIFVCMLDVFVDGMRAVLEPGSVFEFVRENPSFGEAEGFSLEICFPMEGCAVNQSVFGLAHRADFDKESRLFDCRVVVEGLSLWGALAVVEVTETDVRGQFLEGVDAADREYKADILVVNELELGDCPSWDPGEVTPDEARGGVDGWFCLPWIAEGYSYINNRAVSGEEWHEETRALSWQPLLSLVVQRVARAAGYGVDLSGFRGTVWEDALCCNVLPGQWGLPGLAAALPGWTVREFFGHVGRLMGGVFEFDESGRWIGFSFDSDRLAAGGTYRLEVVDSYSAAVSRDEEDADFLSLMRYRYVGSGNVVWKWWSAPWVFEGSWGVSRFESWDAFMDVYGSYVIDDSGHRHPVDGNAGPIFYVADLDTYFVQRNFVIYSEGHVSEKLSEEYRYAHFVDLQPLNVFGPVDWDSDASYVDMGCEPVAVDFALEGKVQWLPVKWSGDDSSSLLDGGMSEFGNSKVVDGVRLSDSLYFTRSRIGAALEQYDGERGRSEFYDRVYVGFLHPDRSRAYPVVDVEVERGAVVADVRALRLGAHGMELIEPRVMYGFEFVLGRGEGLPDCRGVFESGGRRFVCRRMTARFSDSGLERVVRGEFYRLRG